MPIKVTCRCGRAMTLADKWAGKSIPCAACATALKVPGSQAQSAGTSNAGASSSGTSPPPKRTQQAPPPVQQKPALSPSVRNPNAAPRAPAAKAEVLDKVEVFDDVVEVVAGPPPIPKPASTSADRLPPKHRDPQPEVFDHVVEVIPDPPPVPKPGSRPGEQPASSPAPMLITEVYDDVVEVVAGPPPIPVPPVQQVSPQAKAPAPQPPPVPQPSPMAPMLITEILDDGAIPSAACGLAPAADTANAKPQAAETAAPVRDLSLLPTEPIEAPDDSDDEIHEVENLEILEYKDDWQTCGLLDQPGSNDDDENDDEPATSPSQVDDETRGTYRLGAAPDVGTNLGHLGILDAIRIDADYLACVAYGADHKTHLAGCGRDIFILDFAAGDAAELSRQHSGAVTCLSISSDCRYALSGDADGGLMFWDLAKLEALRWLNGHQSEVKTVAFSADGTYAASGGNGGAVRLWKLPRGEMILLQQGQLQDVINCVCFSPDGRLLLAVGSKGRARLWNVAERRPEVKLDLGPSYLRSAAFGRDWIVAGSERRFKVCKWHTGTGERVPCFSGFTKNLHGFQNAFVTPEARTILTVRFNPWEAEFSDYGEDHLDHLYFKGYSEAAAMQKNQANLKSLPDQFNDFFLESWDVFNEVRLSTIGLGPEMPAALATSSDGHRVLAGFYRGMVALVAI